MTNPLLGCHMPFGPPQGAEVLIDGGPVEPYDWDAAVEASLYHMLDMLPAWR